MESTVLALGGEPMLVSTGEWSASRRQNRGRSGTVVAQNRGCSQIRQAAGLRQCDLTMPWYDG